MAWHRPQVKNMEMREIYSRDGAPTGRIVPKHAPVNDGEYFLHAVVILVTNDNRYVMQQRSLRARWYAGKWDVTGGGVAAGETSAQAAAREAYEELGISVAPEDCRFIYREITDWDDSPGGLILDMYFARVSLPDGGMRPDPREVNDVRLVDYEEFVRAISFNKTPGFMEAVKKTNRE